MVFLFLILCAGLLPHSLLAEQGSFTCYYDYSLYNHMCYRLHTAPVANYREAQRVCRNEGGDLVSIHDAFTNTFLKNYGKSEFLIGLRYNKENATYEWSDNTPLDYTNYADGFVDFRDYFGYCAKSVNGRWTNAECETDKLQFICHKRAYSYVSTSPNSCPNESNVHSVPDMILSPGYPSEYNLESSSGCYYQLLTTNDNYVKIRFEEISMNNSLDRILVYMGWNDSPEYLVARGDNDFIDGEVIVGYNRAMIRLLGFGPGIWKITWNAVKSENVTDPSNTVCPPSSTIYVQGGRILSPGYPGEYELTTEASSYGCFYKLYAKEGAFVKLFFEEINFLFDQGFIEIYRGWKDSAGNKIQNVHKTDEETALTVPHNKVLLRVVNATKGSYKIAWSTVEPIPVTTTTTASTTTTVTTTAEITTTTSSPTTPATVCGHGGSPFSGACYLPGPSLLSQPKAEKYCAAYTGHLVSIHSQAEQNFINKNFFPGSAYWIGAYCVWLDAKAHDIYLDQATLFCNWTDTSPFDYSNWMGPRSLRSTMGCSLGNYNGDNTGVWAGYYCASAMNFLCKYHPLQ